MVSQKLYSTYQVEILKRDLQKSGGIDRYLSIESPFSDENCLFNPDIQVSENIELIMPDADGHHDLENSKLIFECYKYMNTVYASDIRIWTYLSHRTFWKYMKLRSPIEEQSEENRVSYILNHWFIQSLNPTYLLRHDISTLWWCAYMTYDQERDNPYVLTEELFTMLDYTRHLLPGTQGRNKHFLQALLEFVSENSKLFSSHKEDKVRFLMRKMNFIAGYKILPTFTKYEIKEMLNSHKQTVASM